MTRMKRFVLLLAALLCGFSPLASAQMRPPVAYFSAGVIPISGAQKVLCSIRGANFNVTTDQACTIPLTITAWAPTAIWCTNASVSMTTAAGGWYPAASKAGTALVAAGQVYTALNAATVILPLTLAANIATTRYTINSVFLSLTSGQGAAATADCYLIGVDLT